VNASHREGCAAGRATAAGARYARAMSNVRYIYCVCMVILYIWCQGSPHGSHGEVHAVGAPAQADGERMPNHASILSAHALYVVSQCVCVVIAPVSDRVRPVAELSLTGADTVRRLGHLTEKSQFETEKSQFETEKSQFDTVGLLLSARNNLRSALCSAIHFCIQ
jgi:hypothetical protein